MANAKWNGLTCFIGKEKFNNQRHVEEDITWNLNDIGISGSFIV